jgi:hypothetical protein
VTEVMPRPRAATAAVFADPATRTLHVRLSELESGYMQTLWRSGWTALRQSYENGWPPSGPLQVYCDGRRDVWGVPTEGGALSFTWPVGVAGYADLVGRPGLYAVVTMDVNTHFISTVKFLHRPG